MRPIHTTFSGKLSNVPTPATLRSIAEAAGCRSGSLWQTVARKIAARAGGLHVLLANGSLFVLTKTADGKLRQLTHKAGTWSFEG
jgi:hypothetical protein